MSDQAQGPGWWQASDGNWYPPQAAPQPLPPTTQGVPIATGPNRSKRANALVRTNLGSRPVITVLLPNWVDLCVDQQAVQLDHQNCCHCGSTCISYDRWDHQFLEPAS